MLLRALDPKHMTVLNKIAEDDTYASLSPVDHDKYINIETHCPDAVLSWTRDG